MAGKHSERADHIGGLQGRRLSSLCFLLKDVAPSARTCCNMEPRAGAPIPHRFPEDLHASVLSLRKQQDQPRCWGRGVSLPITACKSPSVFCGCPHVLYQAI